MVDDVIKKNKNGLYYGNRILLPFSADILKVIIHDEIIMDFSRSKYGAEYFCHEDYTELYCKEIKNLPDELSKYETIKMVIVERGDDIFNFENHQRIALHIKENHKIEISAIDDDILFIE